MGNIFESQTFLRIQLSYTADVSTDIASVKIKYKKPDGTTGEWIAVHDAQNKLVYYDILKEASLQIDGRWRFWIFATMVDDRVLPGEVANVFVHEEGNDKD